MAALKTDNRSVGNRFEEELCVILYENGFWAHNMKQGPSGQPADIIAVKGRFHTLIDAKEIADSRGFPFSRVEENQKLAMRLFEKRCGEMGYFALKLPDGEIRLISLERIETLKARKKTRLTESEIRDQTWSLEKWLKAADVWGRDEG